MNVRGPQTALVAIDLVLLLVIVAIPLRRRYNDDQGDGRTLVLLPRPHPVSPRRTIAFAVTFVVLNVIHELLGETRSLDIVYRRTLASLASIAVPDRAMIDMYLVGFTLGIRFLITATIVSLALTVIASPLRRVLMLGQVALYLATMLCLDALVIVAHVAFGYSVETTTLAAQVIALWAGTFVLLRSQFTTFALPKATELAFAPRKRTEDFLTLTTTTIAGMALVGSVAIVLVAKASSATALLLALVLPLPLTRSVELFRLGALHVIRLLGPRRPSSGEIHTAVDVIIPAYNEERVIVPTLESIDLAAGRYGGSVHVVLVDDGSTDRTNELAHRAIRAFRHATGDVLLGPHGGKSAALNLALSVCTSDIVIRIDADTIVDESCIANAMPWFRDPSIGLVHALLLPLHERSVIDRMRIFETLQLSAFRQRAMQVVDGVQIVPGIFSAFRRAAIVEIGGFTVGMNGEDGDMTLNMSRMGYRTWLDDHVVVYEDVPANLSELREQRIRWRRANYHSSARHSPFRAGLGSPKVWFSVTRVMLNRTLTPVRLCAFFYIVLFIIFRKPSGLGLLLVGTAYSVQYLFTIVVVSMLAIRFQRTRHLPWLVVWPLWVVLGRIFAMEALFTLPTRPVSWRGGAPKIHAPVVH